MAPGGDEVLLSGFTKGLRARHGALLIPLYLGGKSCCCWCAKLALEGVGSGGWGGPLAGLLQTNVLH